MNLWAKAIISNYKGSYLSLQLHLEDSKLYEEGILWVGKEAIKADICSISEVYRKLSSGWWWCMGTFFLYSDTDWSEQGELGGILIYFVLVVYYNHRIPTDTTYILIYYLTLNLIVHFDGFTCVKWNQLFMPICYLFSRIKTIFTCFLGLYSLVTTHLQIIIHNHTTFLVKLSSKLHILFFFTKSIYFLLKNINKYILV